MRDEESEWYLFPGSGNEVIEANEKLGEMIQGKKSYGNHKCVYDCKE